jgi:hypothetical protein
MLGNVFTDLWDGLVSRSTGPLKFRFFLQPGMAIFLAVRCGLRDSREGKPPYFWAIFTDPAQRRELLHDGWKSIGKVFILAVALDCIYQAIELHWIHLFEAILVALLLAIIPYLLVRGPVNRIASFRKTAGRPSAAGQSKGPSPVGKAGIL